MVIPHSFAENVQTLVTDNFIYLTITSENSLTIYQAHSSKRLQFHKGLCPEIESISQRLPGPFYKSSMLSPHTRKARRHTDYEITSLVKDESDVKSYLPLVMKNRDLLWRPPPQVNDTAELPLKYMTDATKDQETSVEDLESISTQKLIAQTPNGIHLYSERKRDAVVNSNESTTENRLDFSEITPASGNFTIVVPNRSVEDNNGRNMEITVGAASKINISILIVFSIVFNIFIQILP